MDSRKRISLALSHREPDRVPVDYWATPEINAALLERYGLDSQEQLLERLGVDLRYIAGPRYVGPAAAVGPDGSVEDHWGVPRVRVEGGAGAVRGTYSEVARSPLEDARSVAEIEDYPG
ncbi:MAG: uroporphyrinogen decarboxylase family protein, partial [Planctomycetota bacterium]